MIFHKSGRAGLCTSYMVAPIMLTFSASAQNFNGESQDGKIATSIQ